ncbi:L,D-transpeptidase [uncultured Roseibium sp.]|uniref:L,D-transpeptidase n=1 Tax=uncultured Roseibium sp. TaxID=1936171 RepID=UPI00321622A8
MNFTRRSFLIGAGSSILAGCSTANRERIPYPTPEQMARYPSEYGTYPTQGAYPPTPANPRTAPGTVRRYPPDVLRMYRAMPEERFPIPAVDLSKINPRYYRQIVNYTSPETIGTIIVDTPNRFLYLTMENGKAMRYGVGIGRDGFRWGGKARIARKKEWPTWTPPSEMIAREPDLEKYRNGMPPGLGNPLGARALYIFEGNRDTLYRIHGTAEAWSIGNAVSSGCVRLLNQDIIDLYSRVPVGTKIVVRQN